ncbi:MAG: 50S ribosomal protein L11 methyltransferase [Oscillospiraceae bacterium]|jgi:ribosomal protein L11 methyltransferase|nr:50S ribosomal protein L11 methyltransferase [Oscillospiraceae bacterium]
MPDWTELIIRTAAEEVDRAGEIAHMVVPYGIYIEDYRELERDARDIAHIDLIDEALLQKDRSVGLVHVYLPPQEHPGEALAFLRERFAACGIAHEISCSACRSEDWENNWKAYFHPLPVGRRLLIQPVWEAPAPADGRAVLLLEPGLAFGSGSHATTRLCLELLERYIRPGCRVLDIGCGSGILAIAALLLGAGNALGVDIDPMAVENARENAARNHLPAGRTTFLQGNLVDCAEGEYDLILSNIVADAIISLAPQLGRRLAPGGVWIGSGIIDARAEEVAAACGAAGWQLAERREEDGWAAFAIKKRPAES